MGRGALKVGGAGERKVGEGGKREGRRRGAF